MRGVRIAAAWACVALALCAAVPASACRIGGDQVLFPLEAVPEILADVRVVRVRFTNTGPDFDGRKKFSAPDPLHSLIEIARLADQTEESRSPEFPVFA